MTGSLVGRQVLITGVGLRRIDQDNPVYFRDRRTELPVHLEVADGRDRYKANIGAAVALACVKAGAGVRMIARSQRNLEIVNEWIAAQVKAPDIDFRATDLNRQKDALETRVWLHEWTKPTDWVQCVGVGAGTVILRDDNPYQQLEDISPELIEAEHTVFTSTVRLFQSLKPLLLQQEESRVCIVSSMSAVRSYPGGGVHCAAKGALSRFANAMAIEQAPLGIYVTDIRPGAVDTGMYDAPSVRQAIAKAACAYGYNWDERQDGRARMMSPLAVANAIVMVLASHAHVTSINMVAKGQWPHEGS